MHRTHTCGSLRIEAEGQIVTLAGWVQTTRDFGKFNFIDLRDRYGITQIAVEQDATPAIYEQSKKLGREYVIQVTGKVRKRSNPNPQNPTGAIEIEPTELQILNASDVPPFKIENETDGLEELRMQYRYLDIRRPAVANSLIMRAKTVKAVRQYLDDKGFLEIETPFLIKSTPEGARDFLVPSRLQPGSFYALPQSPQILKQLLMVAGMDRYYQIVKCFRDEDFRGDRQPEFTQIDCEMSFVEQEDILQMFEGLTKHVYKQILDVNLSDFPRLSYAEAFEKYGTDKPDCRFGMEIQDITKIHFQFHPYDSLIGEYNSKLSLLFTNLKHTSNYDLNDLGTNFNKTVQEYYSSQIRAKDNSAIQKSHIDFLEKVEIILHNAKEELEKSGPILDFAGFNQVDFISEQTKKLKFWKTMISSPNPSISGLVCEGAKFTRKDFDFFKDFVCETHRGAKNLFYIQINEDGIIKSSIEKFFTHEELKRYVDECGANKGDTILFCIGENKKVKKALGDLRLELGTRLNLRKPGDWSVLWVLDFPMFETDPETGELIFVHHPFVSPHPEDIEYLDTDPAKARALCYDMVINGNEIVSGSVRIHRKDIQDKIFGILGLTEAEKTEKFGFLLNAFRYGAPPHAGCAFGLDRWVMLMAGGETIRDVIAFPKNSSGRDLMMDAPAAVPETALKDVGIQISPKAQNPA